MSSPPLPNILCSSSRTPSGRPRMAVTTWNCSFCTWDRNTGDNTPLVAWLDAATADDRPTQITKRSCIRRIPTSELVTETNCSAALAFRRQFLFRVVQTRQELRARRLVSYHSAGVQHLPGQQVLSPATHATEPMPCRPGNSDPVGHGSTHRECQRAFPRHGSTPLRQATPHA